MASIQGSQREVSAGQSNAGPVEEPRPVGNSDGEDDNSASDSDNPDAYEPPAPAEADQEAQEDAEDDADGETDDEMEEIIPIARRQLRQRRPAPPMPRGGVLAQAIARRPVRPAANAAVAPANDRAPVQGPRRLPATTGQIRKPRVRRAKAGSMSRSLIILIPPDV